MGATGIVIARGGAGGKRAKIKYEPLAGRIGEFENPYRRGDVEHDIEHGALYTETGEPIVGYQGDRHSVAVDRRVLEVPNATFTHFHPDKSFGGTLSMQDLKVFARSNLKELRAVSNQGQLYSIRSNGNVDRKGLSQWIRSNQKLAQRNFESSYKSALKQATTPLKSGPHKGEIKLVNRNTGAVTYRQPMTPQQAVNYARAYSVGMFDRMYGKALSRYGVTYTATKAGRNSDRKR